jgi:CSLREA domain-containing protein
MCRPIFDTFFLPIPLDGYKINYVYFDRKTQRHIMLKRTTITSVLLSLGIVALLILTASPATAAKIKINSTADIIADDGYCTLREAVIAANTDTASGSMDGECPAGDGADEIVLQSGVYKLAIGGLYEDNAQAGDLDILDDLTITGKGAKETIIDCNNIDRVFHVMSNVRANFNGINIQNGSISNDNGGGIYNSGMLTVTKSTVSGNTASSTSITILYGGGIYNDGTLTITKSKVSNNTASGSKLSYGGGIYNDGTLTITKSTVSGNTASSTDTLSIGGGIFNDMSGTIKVTKSTVSGNTASSTNGLSIGGGIYNDGTATITKSRVSGNTASSTISTAYGGGIYNDGTITITKSKVSGNISDGNYRAFGGGIYNNMNGTITVEGISRISGNTADDGGGVYNSGIFYKSKRTRIKNNLLEDSWGIQ